MVLTGERQTSCLVFLRYLQATSATFWDPESFMQLEMAGPIKNGSFSVHTLSMKVLYRLAVATGRIDIAEADRGRAGNVSSHAACGSAA